MRPPAHRTRRARELVSLLVFVVVFTPAYLTVRALTGVLRISGWPRWWPRAQRRLGIRNRVLFLEIAFPEDAGHQHRIRSWLPVLERAGYVTRVGYPLSESISRALLEGGWVGVFYSAYLVRRIAQCLSAPFHNCVVVRRELLRYNDYGNLFLERFLLALNPNVVLDFDDDIAAAKHEPRRLSLVGRVLRENPTKFGDSLRLYRRFIAGSAYLRGLVEAARGGDHPADIEVIPTCPSYADAPAKAYGEDPPTLTFGWIGTDGNLPELEEIVGDLAPLAAAHPLRLLVISGRGLEITAPFPIENRRWSLSTEVADLLEIDVGLMPLRDTRAARGKCGFKLLQYMALGIVGVASAITTNREIVTHGVDGFLVEPGESWAGGLRDVLARRDDFPRIGAAAQARVRDEYSVHAHADRYVSFIARASAVPGRGPA